MALLFEILTMMYRSTATETVSQAVTQTDMLKK